ncbi:Hypothetical protein MexAM1_META1p4787 [Methylorubrum extorquens AM1]|uniref:Uncharacterized protein n=1 Tax=Methylorubrum extorquens (strain ATCC 14718 / DSM 1338 / JCM 2805 / NCIMB 9133 / AM1) TaxID=272630 RepID=C5ARR5_METEA|nr:Hypothetical protein MexAM1_META1p4787 [Methylorubrum extorquens AM1]
MSVRETLGRWRAPRAWGMDRRRGDAADYLPTAARLPFARPPAGFDPYRTCPAGTRRAGLFRCWAYRSDVNSGRPRSLDEA